MASSLPRRKLSTRWITCSSGFRLLMTPIGQSPVWMHAAKGRFPLHQNAFAAHLTAAGEAETVLAVLTRDLAVARMSALEAEKAADVDEPRSPRSARRHRIIARTWCSETFVHTDRAGFGLPILLTFAPCPDSSTPRLSLMSSAGKLLVLLLARRCVPMEALEHALTTAGAD